MKWALALAIVGSAAVLAIAVREPTPPGHVIVNDADRYAMKGL